MQELPELIKSKMGVVIGAGNPSAHDVLAQIEQAKYVQPTVIPITNKKELVKIASEVEKQGILQIRAREVDCTIEEIQERDKELARAAKLNKMRAYANRYLARHPKTKPDRLQKIVCKKFNVKLT